MSYVKNLSIACIYKTGDGDNKRMFGIVAFDDRFEKGHLIQTSPIVSVDEEKHIVETYNGSVYYYEELKSEDDFLEFCRKDDQYPLRYGYVKQVFSLKVKD